MPETLAICDGTWYHVINNSLRNNGGEMSRKAGIKRILFLTAVIVLTAMMLGCSCDLKKMLKDSFIRDEEEKVLKALSEYRDGKMRYLHFTIGSSFSENPDFSAFLESQALEMYENGEDDLLNAFLKQLEAQDIRISALQDLITNAFESSETLEDAIKTDERYKSLRYYNAGIVLNRKTGLLASYIETNGVNLITDTPGTGFYADKEDRYSSKKVGLDTSPLYDAVSDTYMGDFWHHLEYGVKLNHYYEETPYSKDSYYFRDHFLRFSPKAGECVYSGDYLFCFDPNGDMINFTKIG